MHRRSSVNISEQIDPGFSMACLPGEESCPSSVESLVNSGVSLEGSSENCPGLNLP